MKIHVINARLAFAQGLFVAKAATEVAKKKYGCDLIIEPGKTKVFLVAPDGKKTETTAEKAVLAVATEAWKSNAANILKSIESSKKCLRDGNARVNAEGVPYQGYPGKMFINAKNISRPTVIDGDRTPLTEDSGKPYSGCYVNALLDVYAMKDPTKRGVYATLGGVMFSADGEAFGGGGYVASETDFESVTVADDDLMG